MSEHLLAAIFLAIIGMGLAVVFPQFAGLLLLGVIGSLVAMWFDDTGRATGTLVGLLVIVGLVAHVSTNAALSIVAVVVLLAFCYWFFESNKK